MTSFNIVTHNFNRQFVRENDLSRTDERCKQLLKSLNEINVLDPLDNQLSQDIKARQTLLTSTSINDRESREKRIRAKQLEYGFEPDSKEQIIFDQELRDKCGRTPIHEAVLDGNIKRIEELLTDGADVQKKDNDGMTAVQLAVMEENEAILVVFNKHGLF